MKKLIFAALVLSGCEAGPPEHGGMTSIGITGMAARLQCPYDNVRIENSEKSLASSSWDAVCTMPAKG